MPRERTNTAGRLDILPEGTNEFMIAGPVKKFFVGPNKDIDMFVFPLQFDGGIGEQAFLPNMLGPLLRDLGCQEVSKNVFYWDTDDLEGKKFTATVTHFQDSKDPSITRSKMEIIPTERRPEIPF